MSIYSRKILYYVRTCLLLQYLLEDVEAMFEMAIREVGESEDAPKSCSCNEKSVHVCVCECVLFLCLCVCII